MFITFVPGPRALPNHTSDSYPPKRRLRVTKTAGSAAGRPRRRAGDGLHVFFKNFSGIWDVLGVLGDFRGLSFCVLLCFCDFSGLLGG